MWGVGLSRLFISLLLLALTGSRAVAGPVLERDDWAHYFRDAGTEGAFVLYDLHKDVYQAHNIARAEQRITPASTFKIANSLIALQTGVVKSERQIFKWDGVQRPNEDWNRDHDFASAFKFSVVPIFQRIARKIGVPRMRKYLHALAYGNEEVGTIDRFWLDGTLQISALEQVRFLRKLYKNSLPLNARSMRIVKSIMVVETTPEYVLHAKTGWAEGTPQVGWWVGWIEQHNGDVYFFALNLDISRPEHVQQRELIVRNILAQEGVLPAVNATTE